MISKLANNARAGEGTRTLDIQLGKLALYQLSYARNMQLPSLPLLAPGSNTLVFSHRTTKKDAVVNK
jgi:hypothetical protein